MTKKHGTVDNVSADDGVYIWTTTFLLLDSLSARCATSAFFYTAYLRYQTHGVSNGLVSIPMLHLVDMEYIQFQFMTILT